MIKVYGYSDDNLVIEENGKCIEEIGCWGDTVKIWFSDGTIVECGYGKNDKGIWFIKLIVDGIAPNTLTECEDEDAEVYSDVLEVDAKITKWCLGSEGEEVADLRVLFEDIKKKYPLQTIESAYNEVFG